MFKARTITPTIEVSLQVRIGDVDHSFTASADTSANGYTAARKLISGLCDDATQVLFREAREIDAERQSA